MARLSRWSAALLTLTLIACGGKSEPAPQPAAKAPEPSKTEPKEEPKKEPKKEPKEEPKEEPTKAPPATTEANADAGAAGEPDSGFPKTVVDAPTLLVTATPGTVVRDPVPDSPEWLIQQVLLASMEPDEAKGWEMFAALLHEDQKLPNALTSRRELNYPASRRKVKLFLFEDPTKPIYKVARVVEESPKQVRIFVFNNSEGAMPTPCELRMDDNVKKWRVGICSL